MVYTVPISPLIPQTITSTIIGSKTATITLEPTTTIFASTTSANSYFPSLLNSCFHPETSIFQLLKTITPLVASITLLLIIIILILAFRLWYLVDRLKNRDCGDVVGAMDDVQRRILERLPEKADPPVPPAAVPPPVRGDPYGQTQQQRQGDQDQQQGDGSSTAQTPAGGLSGHPVQQPAGFFMVLPHYHCQLHCSRSCGSYAQPIPCACSLNPTSDFTNQSHGPTCPPTPATPIVVQCNC